MTGSVWGLDAGFASGGAGAWSVGCHGWWWLAMRWDHIDAQCLEASIATIQSDISEAYMRDQAPQKLLLLELEAELCWSKDWARNHFKPVALHLNKKWEVKDARNSFQKNSRASMQVGLMRRTLRQRFGGHWRCVSVSNMMGWLSTRQSGRQNTNIKPTNKTNTFSQMIPVRQKLPTATWSRLACACCFTSEHAHVASRTPWTLMH